MAAQKEIGLTEAYLYVPMKLVICESKVRKSEIGHLLDLYEDTFSDPNVGEHLKLTFFVLHEMSKGEKSLWAPYFAISEMPDIPMLWDDKDLKELHDEIMVQAVMDQREEIMEEHENMLEIAQNHSDILDPAFFTFENFCNAHLQVVTRCFGYSIPELMLVPFADCANHHAADNIFEIFNSRIAKAFKEGL